MIATATLPSALPVLTQIAAFDVPEAGQGVAVDAQFFYAVDNTTIAKYDKKTGARIKAWAQAKGGPLIHLDGAMVMDGKIYAPHSNYPAWPMTSSLPGRISRGAIQQVCWRASMPAQASSAHRLSTAE